ncbi:ABC transporter permease [Seleniivibrio woodruffii]|uniref:ABC transporter permease n=1 Tax=Seleniivibrio woodruffii TaxID=1078050 RepID=UPI0039E69B71
MLNAKTTTDIFGSFYKSRRLLAKLVLNDFKSKYLGSFLGLLWAFIQPSVTIFIFWFVFHIGFKSQPVQNAPFLLWLLAGIIPWFFFADAVNNGANSITDFSYLVKKIVFDVKLLPFIKLFSSLIIHIFFIMILFGFTAGYGIKPSAHWFQIFYYLFAMIFLLTGISLITCSVTVFLKDMGQIVGMLTQIGFWGTPIFWSINIIPEKYHWLIKLNPVFYITEGYRASLIYKEWFWDSMKLTIYFWCVSIIIMAVGVLVFRKLRPHFADVL